MFYFVRNPGFLKWLIPGMEWDMRGRSSSVFLTFDDGPDPEITPWVLDTLKRFDAKATFFVVGANVDRSPDVFQRLLDEGHTVGNHTYDHCHGRMVSDSDYFKSIAHCAENVASELFRPPYGRIRKSQIRELRKEHRIIMWDVLSADFDPKVDPEKCTRNVLNNVREGSIVVFHDSPKAFPKLKEALPATLEHFAEKGFTFEAIKGRTS